MKPGIRILISCVVCGCSTFCAAKGKIADGLAVAGHVFSGGAALQPGEIDARSVTRINYAFVN